MPYQLKEVIFVKVFGDPECDVFIAGWILAVGFKLAYLAHLELLNKAGIFAPEQPYVVDLKKLHCPAFKT